MAQHDNGYKVLFSHPEMVRDLLTGFVQEPWVAELDFATLEKVSGSYVADDLRDREDDIVWRVCFRERWLYVYLLLEFQSTVDDFMAVRLLTYLGLLYQDIIAPAVRARLQTASVEQIEDWAERILDAKDLEAVFAQDT